MGWLFFKTVISKSVCIIFNTKFLFIWKTLFYIAYLNMLACAGDEKTTFLLYIYKTLTVFVLLICWKYNMFSLLGVWRLFNHKPSRLKLKFIVSNNISYDFKNFKEKNLGAVRHIEVLCFLVTPRHWFIEKQF